MGEHTKEPWDARGLMIMAGRERVAHFGISNNFHPPRPYEVAANARRTAAAVNFTAGYPTASLEGITLEEVVQMLAKCEAFIKERSGGGETEFREPVRALLTRLTKEGGKP